MKALYNKHGRVAAYLKGNRIIDLSGHSKAWVHSDGSVYDYRGQHKGWWHGDHMRGADGGALVWLKGARNLGVIPPLPELPPLPPLSKLEPLKPLRSLPPLRPLKKLGWSSSDFFNKVG